MTTIERWHGTESLPGAQMALVAKITFPIEKSKHCSSPGLVLLQLSGFLEAAKKRVISSCIFSLLAPAREERR